MFFRTVKQTGEHAKLHCLRPQNVLIELNSILLGTWYVLYYRKQAQLNEGIPMFIQQLASEILNDEFDRTSGKASRSYTSKKKHRKCGKPIINDTTADPALT